MERYQFIYNSSQTHHNYPPTPKIVEKTSVGEEFQQKVQNQNCNSHKKNKVKILHWSAQEDKIYMKFLEEHGLQLRYKSVRREKHIFRLLSEKMCGRRTPIQCKSHHQKMKKATEKGTVKEILEYLKRKYVWKQIQENQRSRRETSRSKKIMEKNNEFTIACPNKGMVDIKIDFNFLAVW